jgi:hypothetical protein
MRNASTGLVTDVRLAGHSLVRLGMRPGGQAKVMPGAGCVRMFGPWANANSQPYLLPICDEWADMAWLLDP